MMGKKILEAVHITKYFHDPLTIKVLEDIKIGRAHV